STFAQAQRPPRWAGQQTVMAETAIKNAMEQLTNERKVDARELDVRQHIRAADDALADAMQPNNAIQKALDEISEAKRLNPDVVVMNGVLKALGELENAHRSPMAADFDHMRTTVRSDAAGPASRAVARNA